MHVILMGPRASGKTTVGEALASAIQREFVDLDAETLRAFVACPTVSQAWLAHGEQAWRTAESAAIDRVLAGPARVIALGGGTPMIPKASAMLQQARDCGTAAIIYLQCDAKTLQERLRHECGDRPPLRGANVFDEVEAILREREPAYCQLASVAVDASADPSSVVHAITNWLQSLQAPGR